MPTMTLAVPIELKRKMDEHDHINWSAVARKAFEEQLTMLEFFQKVQKKSNMTEKDAISIGRMINSAAFKRMRNETSR